MSKRTKRTIAALIGALSVVAPTTATAQRLVTLREAVSLAVAHDARVLDAEAKEQRAGREADVASARFGPNLFTGTGAIYTSGFPQTPDGGTPSVFNLAFTQTLFDGPARGRQRAASERVEARKIETARVRDEVTLDTLLAYLELASTRQAIDRQLAARRSAGEIVDLAIERLNAGRILPADVLEARLSASRLAQRITQLEGREAELEHQLRLATGLPAGPLQVAFENLPSLPDRSLDELVALARAGSVELMAAHLERRAREETLTGARHGYWPSVDLVGRYSLFSRFNNVDAFYGRFQANSLNVGFQARVPLFSAETGAATALARSALVEIDATIKRQEDEIALDVQHAAQTAREGVAARDVAELQLAIAQEAVRVTGARADEGRASRLDAGKALADEGRAWDGFFQAEFERVRGQLQLRRLTGELRALFP